MVAADPNRSRLKPEPLSAWPANVVKSTNAEGSFHNTTE